MAQNKFSLRRKLEEVPQNPTGPGNQLYSSSEMYNGMGLNRGDEEFLRTGDPSNSDVQVNIDDKGTEPDTALELTRTTLLWFMCVAYGFVAEEEGGKKNMHCGVSLFYIILYLKPH